MERPVSLCCFQYEAFLIDKPEQDQRCLGRREVPLPWGTVCIWGLPSSLLCSASRGSWLFLRHVCLLSTKAFSKMRGQNVCKARFFSLFLSYPGSISPGLCSGEEHTLAPSSPGDPGSGLQEHWSLFSSSRESISFMASCNCESQV